MKLENVVDMFFGKMKSVRVSKLNAVFDVTTIIPGEVCHVEVDLVDAK